MENKIIFSRGVLQLTGPRINSLAENQNFQYKIPQRALEQRVVRDGLGFHLTLTHPDELIKEQEKQVLELWEGGVEAASLPTWIDQETYEAYRAYCHQNLVKDLFPIGGGKCVSGSQSAFYIVVLWPRASVFRQALRLPEKHFHITLGFDNRDIHTASKGISTLVRADWKGLCYPQPGVSDVPFLRMLQIAENKKCDNNHSAQLLAAAQTALTEMKASCECPQGVMEMEVNFQIARAKVEGRNKNFELVLNAGEDILAMEPNNLEGLGFKAFALLQLGQLDAAYEVVNQFPKEGAEDCKKMKQLSGIKKTVLTKYNNTVSMPEKSSIKGPGHLKYPRTAHLKNLGAATDDDVVKPEAAAHFIKNGVVYIEEKIDGANIGISLGDNHEFVIQNRGHVVNSATMAQFSQIESWAEENSSALYSLLSETDGVVLYGEWCLAQHSVEYRKLPGYFIAFDIWNGEDFLTRAAFHTKMQETRIPVVPIVYKGEIDSEAQLLKMIEESESRFGAVWSRQKADKAEDFPHLEGLMLRKEESGKLAHRMKLVRGSFTQGIETHWCKQDLVKNRIDFDFQEEYLNFCYTESENVSCTNYNNEDPIGPHLAEMPSLNPREHLLVHISQSQSLTKFSKKKLEVQGEPGKTMEVTMQRNFSFITPEIAVSSTPKDADQVRAMCEAFNIGICLTLTEECPLPKEWFGPSAGGIKNVFVPVPNYHPPTEEQTDMILELFKEHILGEENIPNVLIHCGGGKGRAGTVAAACLMKWGLGSLKKQKNRTGVCTEFADSSEVIRYLRHQRPGSIETERQEKFIRAYSQRLWREAFQNQIEEPDNLQSKNNDQEDKFPVKEASPLKTIPNKTHSEETSCTKSIENRLDDLTVVAKPPSTSRKTEMLEDSRYAPWLQDAVEKARKFSLVMLCGFPGCGKSSFGSLAKTRFGEAVKILTQDDMGREALERAVSSSWKSISSSGKTLIIDRCNVRAEDREKILNLCFNPPASRVLCVYFATPAEVCIKRVKQRLDHPTISYGRGENAVKQFVKQLEVPGKSSGAGKKGKGEKQTLPFTLLTVDDGVRQDEDQQLVEEYAANFVQHEDRMQVDFSEVENILERLTETDLPGIASRLFRSSQENTNGQELVESFFQDVYLVRKTVPSLVNPEMNYALCIIHYSQNSPGFDRAVLTKPLNIPLEASGVVRDIFLWNAEMWERKQFEGAVFERGIAQYGWKLL